MSTRQEDISELNERLENLASKRLVVFEEYKTESQGLNDKAKSILEEAGILEQWTELEKEKAELNARFQKLLDPYNNAIQQVQGVRNWLSSKENPVAPEVAPAISEETVALESSLEEGGEDTE
jgi:uncharacterized coiled-coil DUF342 family protein